ncbi:GFA family protein [Rhodospirillaceae bacterium KN72]|uniref:GFA family protein n=1 Tax=Pacificispira spongiicola TaxID=2729598 RepID=A0A7Y0DYW5_9PROT|nr:GFA family protein [Pacificispira spongiicola]NMM44132.1 GFA family protein [Pacificispira spongiicola]
MSDNQELDVREGGCLCGGVRYRLDGPLPDVTTCHCNQCRKTSGHYVAMTSIPKDRLTFLSDETLTWFPSSDFAERGFCNRCGGNLFYHRLGHDSYAITAGTMDGKTGLKTVRNIFVEDKGDYYDLPDV